MSDNPLANVGDLGKSFNTLVKKIAEAKHQKNMEDITAKFEGLTGFSQIRLPKRFAMYYYGKPLSLEMAEDANNELKTGKVLLTRIGQELAPICGSQPIESFYESVKEQWKEYLPAAEKD